MVMVMALKELEEVEVMRLLSSLLVYLVDASWGFLQRVSVSSLWMFSLFCAHHHQIDPLHPPHRTACFSEQENALYVSYRWMCPI